MASVFPVFIGITGKRRLSEAPDRAEAVERSVRARLASVFDHIERLLPHTPKILLTGLAAGADLLAAQEVLKAGPLGKLRSNWLVVAALPFDEALFREDFTPEEWTAYEEVARDPRTRRWVLPELATSTGQAARATHLMRASATEEDKELRRRHYEQVGLWIADTANVLVAVMPAGEQPEKVGGTARIVAHRRGDPLDATAAEVLAVSSVLSARNELQRPASGFVWLIDPAREEKTGTLPVRVLAPHDEEYVASTGPMVLLDQSLALLSRARHLERDRLERAANSAPVSTWPNERDPASVLAESFRSLSAPANRASEISRNAFGLLAGLFLASFVLFEVFAKFLFDRPGILALYIVFLTLTIGLYFLARQREWQPIAEDMRAIREVLRVQLAWWRSGLGQRVFDFYLQGADRELARVREGVRNLVVMAELCCPGVPPLTNWKPVFDPDDRKPFHAGMRIADHPEDWVGSQLYYFRQRRHQREAKHRFIEELSWILFVTSGLLALLLCAWLFPTGKEWLSTHGLMGGLASHMAIAGTVAGIAVAVACWWGFSRVHRELDLGSGLGLAAAYGLTSAAALWIALHGMAVIALVGEDPLGMTALLPLIVLAAVGATFGGYWLARVLRDTNATRPVQTVMALGAIVTLTLAVISIASKFSAHFGHVESEELVRERGVLAEYMTILIIAFLPAMAGALRFVAEKMAVEAEARSYRDALEWFERADRLLSEARPGEGRPEADARARDIVLKLGILALGESQQWLKSRRERPLSPLIGG